MALTIKSALPDASISQFVHSFWMVENKTGKVIQATVLPNGTVDLVLIKESLANPKMLVRMPSQVTIITNTQLFSVSFKASSRGLLIWQFSKPYTYWNATYFKRLICISFI